MIVRAMLMNITKRTVPDRRDLLRHALSPQRQSTSIQTGFTLPKP
jgi:hypothetical protein